MRINEDYIKNKIGDECVLVPIGDGYRNGLFTLNETAERIFDLLSEEKEHDEIVSTLCEEYETDKQTAEEYVYDYILQLRKAGILLDE